MRLLYRETRRIDVMQSYGVDLNANISLCHLKHSLALGEMTSHIDGGPKAVDGSVKDLQHYDCERTREESASLAHVRDVSVATGRGRNIARTRWIASLGNSERIIPALFRRHSRETLKSHGRVGLGDNNSILTLVYSPHWTTLRNVKGPVWRGNQALGPEGAPIGKTRHSFSHLCIMSFTVRTLLYAGVGSRSCETFTASP